MSTDVDTEEVVGRRPRSPNHPVISLDDALKRAALLMGKGGTFSLPIGVVHDRLKYKRFTALAERIVGALAAYGLITVRGEKESRQVSITDRCQRILKNAPDKKKQLEDAALAPAIHRELWDHWEGRGLPPDDVLRNYLLWEREGIKFTEASVDDFIANLRETLAFSGLQTEDNIVDGGDAERADEDIDGEICQMVQAEHSPVAAQSPNPFHRGAVSVAQSGSSALPTIGSTIGGMQEYPLYGSAGRGALSVPAKMSRKDFELYKTQINNSLNVIEATAVSEPDGAQEEKAHHAVVVDHR